MHVTFDDAQQAIAAALRKAEQLGTQMCIAVVDSGASLKAFARMNDAWVGSIDIAIKKAKTACFFGMPTGQIGRLSQPGGSLFGIEHSNEGLITFPGGLPIVNKAFLLGRLGSAAVQSKTIIWSPRRALRSLAFPTCQRIRGGPKHNARRRNPRVQRNH